jgi:hypothetical protein
MRLQTFQGAPNKSSARPHESNKLATPHQQWDPCRTPRREKAAGRRRKQERRNGGTERKRNEKEKKGKGDAMKLDYSWLSDPEEIHAE